MTEERRRSRMLCQAKLEVSMATDGNDCNSNALVVDEDRGKVESRVEAQVISAVEG